MIPAKVIFSISYLLFTDDTMLFCKVDQNQIKALKATLLFYFEVASHLNVNFKKSELVPVGKVCNISQLVNLLKCKVSFHPLKYMGLTLGSAFRA